MCIPPNDNDSNLYFSKMNELLNTIGLKELSMGMSNDYLKAVEHNSSYIRVGSSFPIFTCMKILIMAIQPSVGE